MRNRNTSLYYYAVDTFACFCSFLNDGEWLNEEQGQLSQYYTDYAMDWTSGFRFPSGLGIFSLRHRV
jgi:hypothetical protein